MKSSFFGLAVAGAISVLATGPSGAMAKEVGTSGRPALTQTYPGEAYSQYYRRGFRGGRYGYYGRGYRRGYGGAVGAGIAGLAAGALIGGAIASSQAAPAYAGPGTPVGNIYGHDPNAVNYCASRYRSYDPASGTFLGNDGNRYACP